MLSFKHITKDYQLDLKTKITPVKDVTLDVNKGEFLIIIGRSGSGKTTLLNMAAGLVKPTSGKVEIDNVDLGQMTDAQLSELRTKRMGFIFQFPSLLSAFTIMENVTLPTIFKDKDDKKETEKRAAETLNKMGLSSKKNVYPKQLSAGEQKRVVLSRALINNPDIILADEPTSDLDAKTETEVMELLKEINSSGVTILMVTHSLQLLPFANRAFEMENGNLNEVVKPKLNEI